jgi:hypothetical protein
MKSFFLVVFFFISTGVFSQTSPLAGNRGKNWTSTPDKEISFSRITSENGLPSDYIQTIFRDHYGFLWIATGNGLCRYDGKQVIEP